MYYRLQYPLNDRDNKSVSLKITEKSANRVREAIATSGVKGALVPLELAGGKTAEVFVSNSIPLILTPANSEGTPQVF